MFVNKETIYLLTYLRVLCLFRCGRIDTAPGVQPTYDNFGAIPKVSYNTTVSSRSRRSRSNSSISSSVSRSCLGILGGKTSGYFLASECSGYFRFISDYVLTSGLADPKPPSQVSAGISIFCRNSTSGLNSISGSTFIPRPPRVRDRVTISEAGPAPGRITAGVGSVFRGAGTEPNSPDRSVRPTLRLLPAISSNYLLT